MNFTILLLLPAALVAAAALLYAGLKLYKEWQAASLEQDNDSALQVRRKYAKKAAIVALVLSVLVLIRALDKFYWFMVWDATYDPLGILWLPLPMLTVLGSGAVLFSRLPGKAKFASFAYLLLIPLLIVAVTFAGSVDFRQLTQARAEQVRQAIEAYNAWEGHYPENIQQLFPQYAVSLPGPTIIYGQDWCYQGGNDHYRLGYLDREHWSSPILFGRVYSAVGYSPLKADVCQ
jgi:hypothetical protein